MKVAIDISPLNSDHQFRGVGIYTKYLVEALQLIKAADFSVQLIEHGNIPEDCDLVHYPFFDLFKLTLPLKKGKPTVVTIHDVIPLIFPKKFPKGLKGWGKLQIQKQSLRNTEAVLTDSECSKKDIFKYLKYPKEKIFVIPLASGKEFKKLKKRPDYKLPEKFILYVGDVNWNKNVPGLVRAFQKLKDPDLKLVFVGKAFKDEGLKETKEIIQLIKELKLEDRVIFLGFVSTEDLVKIYNLATVYCQPSFYEGFGVPVLEAMACGCPVVAANVASLPEICGNAAVMVNPYDILSIIDGIKVAIHNRRELVEKGFRQSRKFSWEETARETIKVYQKIYSE